MKASHWELYQTDLGKFWLPSPGENLVMWLVWEMAIQKDYENHDARILPGDTVIDCGAHVGVFTKYALQQGAAQVVAIEPDPTNLACLEANLAPEIANGVVSVVKGGVWDRRTRLTLFGFDHNSAAFTFLGDSSTRSEEEILVFPLDEIVERLKLSRVDFIKMDIEGSEQRALRGGRQTITRFRPRMAICAYHVPDDPTAIPAIVRQMQPAYRIHAKDVDFGRQSIVTKVLFFH